MNNEVTYEYLVNYQFILVIVVNNINNNLLC